MRLDDTAIRDGLTSAEAAARAASQALDQAERQFQRLKTLRASGMTSAQQLEDAEILATQRLLEALKGRPLKMLVYAGSSSVYGDAEVFPTAETALPAPLSPYGVTKLAGEHLAYVYWKNGNLNVVYSAWIAAGLLLGAFVGAKLVQPVSDLTLRRMFGVFLILVAIRMIWGK